MLDQALTLASVVIGTSYYKTWPTEEIIFNNSCFDSIFDILEASYHKGLSQFIFENHLDPDKMGHPACLNEYHIQPPTPHAYESRGILALQSGGKDSILTATILNEKPMQAPRPSSAYPRHWLRLSFTLLKQTTKLVNSPLSNRFRQILSDVWISSFTASKPQRSPKVKVKGASRYFRPTVVRSSG